MKLINSGNTFVLEYEGNNYIYIGTTIKFQTIIYSNLLCKDLLENMLIHGDFLDFRHVMINDSFAKLRPLFVISEEYPDVNPHIKETKKIIKKLVYVNEDVENSLLFSDGSFYLDYRDYRIATANDIYKYTRNKFILIRN